jgi:uncharacterized protein (TIGR03032 family)
MEPQLEINASRKFNSWLGEQKASIAFSTYQAGKLFLIGLKQDGSLSVFERTFERAMGLCVKGSSLYLATLYQIWRFENSLAGESQRYQGYDGLYVPQASSVTGDIDVHDIVVDSRDQLYFANTLFSCVAEVSPTHSFKPYWQPSFVSKLAAEDRCHLNGLAMENDKPAYITAVSTTDVHEGWREHRRDGGIVMDIRSNEIIADGLSMPHSPRLHNGELYFLNSGEGELVKLNPKTGEREVICFCPGYARGLSFMGDYALIGLSKPRENKSFNGLALNEKLEAKKISPRCGLQVVNLKTGDVEHTLSLEGVVTEIYDVATLAGITTPMAIGLKTKEIQHMISVEG